jgi:hypothetical protein
MTPDRPLFGISAQEQELFAFYDAVAAAEDFDRDETYVDVDELLETAVSFAQARGLLEHVLGAVLVEDEAV